MSDLSSLVAHFARVLPPLPDRLKGKRYSHRAWRNAYMKDLMRRKRNSPKRGLAVNSWVGERDTRPAPRLPKFAKFAKNYAPALRE
jgi:hypothetical protein